MPTITSSQGTVQVTTKQGGVGLTLKPGAVAIAVKQSGATAVTTPAKVATSVAAQVVAKLTQATLSKTIAALGLSDLMPRPDAAIISGPFAAPEPRRAPDAPLLIPQWPEGRNAPDAFRLPTAALTAAERAQHPETVGLSPLLLGDIERRSETLGLPLVLIGDVERRPDTPVLGPGLPDARRSPEQILVSPTLTDFHKRPEVPQFTPTASDQAQRPETGLFTVDIKAVAQSGTPDSDMWGDSWTDATVANQGANHGSDTTLKVSQGTAQTENRAFIKADLRKFSGLSASSGGHYLKLRITNGGVAAQNVNVALQGQAGNPFTESTITWNNQPATPTAITKSLSAAVGTASYQVPLTDAEMNQLLGNWALIVITAPSTVVQITVQSREQNDGNQPAFHFTATR